MPTRRRRRDTHGPDDGKGTTEEWRHAVPAADNTPEALIAAMKESKRRHTAAHTLTPAQPTFLSRYEALRPERRRVVDDLLRELSKLP